MKPCIIIALIVWLFVPALGADLKSREVFNTQPFACTGEQRLLYWINDTGSRIYFKSFVSDMGLSFGGRADFKAVVVRGPDNVVMVDAGWDRYAEPTGPVTQEHSFAPDWYELNPGEPIWLVYRCMGFGNFIPEGHVRMIARYTTTTK